MTDVSSDWSRIIIPSCHPDGISHHKLQDNRTASNHNVLINHPGLTHDAAVFLNVNGAVLAISPDSNSELVGPIHGSCEYPWKLTQKQNINEWKITPVTRLALYAKQAIYARWIANYVKSDTTTHPHVLRPKNCQNCKRHQ